VTAPAKALAAGTAQQKLIVALQPENKKTPLK